MSSLISLGREISCFAVPEVTAGTLVEPAAADLVLSINEPTITQELETFDDAQIRNSRSKLAAIAGRYLAGSWALDTYMKPSGTAGSIPQEDELLNALLGTKTVRDSTNIDYTLAGTTIDLPSLSLWFKDGHTVYFCTGATVNQGVFKVEGRNPGTISWSGGFMKKLWTGTSALGAAIADTTSTTITVTNAINVYSTGSVIQIDSEIMKVVTVNAGTLVVTRGYKSSSAATHLNAAVVSPWWLTGTEIGTPVHGRLGFVTLDTTNYNTLTNQVTITNGVKYYEEEKNGESFCSAYGTPASRAVAATVTAYFRKGEVQRFKDAYDWDSIALVIPCGDTAGSIVEIKLPQCKLKAPAVTGAEERIIDLTILPFASASLNDEVVVRYR